MLQSELDPTLRTHLHKHFGVHVTLYLHMEPGVWSHDLLLLATISIAVIANMQRRNHPGGNGQLSRMSKR